MRKAALLLPLLMLAIFVISCGDDDTQSPPAPPPNNLPGLIDPVWEYSHSLGNAVTGGYVYRGSTAPSLVGKYVYADHGTGRIWAITYDGMGAATNELVYDAPFFISTFGMGSDGELYLMQRSGAGRIFRIDELTPASYSLTEAFTPTLTFNQGVDIRNAGAADTRLFVVEQVGRILVFDTSNPQTPETFLDISTSVASGGETGLLGLAFHPDYATNGYFFVYYTTRGALRVRISRFSVTSNPDSADAGSEAPLLNISQRQGNHNGGGLAFDGNGYLLVAVGDEGGGGDVYDNAQDRTTLHGSILRLDVDVPASPYYQIPPDNPFVGNSDGYAQEIFAWGMRNPWRISYDAMTDRIWTGDVGQGQWEEIDVIEWGGNYGWDCREGMHDYIGPPDGPSPVCAGVNP